MKNNSNISSRQCLNPFYPVLLILFFSLPINQIFSQQASGKTMARIALFNIWEMSTEKLLETDENGTGTAEQLLAAAEIIQIIRPDVLVINEIDHDIDAFQEGQNLTLNARRFIDNYLKQGERSVDFRFIYAAPCNTGFLAGMDFDNNSVIASEQDRHSRDHGGDCFGYGEYPGQYSMAVLSRFPLDFTQARTFQKFLWKDLPDNQIPDSWYSEDELDIFRLSSKSHWDVPVKIGSKTIHLLVSHPTPPVFDGLEDRNGRRNFDEIKMWVHYINNDQVMVDDNGFRGGLGKNESFIIAGDLNAAPFGEKMESGERSIDKLLNHPLINDCGNLLVSPGALNGQTAGPPGFIERRTTGWGDRGLRIDHLLPSKDLNVIAGGVYWPADSAGVALVKKASDHRLVWLELEIN